MQMSPSAMTTLLWVPCKNLSLENYVHADEIFSMDHHCCTTTAVWLQWSCLARNSFPWLSQEILMCTGKKEHHLGLRPAIDFYIWPAGSDLPLYLTWNPPANLYISLDLKALPCLYIWPARSDLPLYLTCELWPTLYFILPARSEYLYTWLASSDLPLYLTYKVWLPLYLTCQLWPTFIFDLPAVTYLYIWPASSDLPLYLTCKRKCALPRVLVTVTR